LQQMFLLPSLSFLPLARPCALSEYTLCCIISLPNYPLPHSPFSVWQLITVSISISLYWEAN
jgi:hypothetical protein